MEGGTLRSTVAVDTYRRLQPFVNKVAPFDKLIMRLRVKHTLGFISLVAVCAPPKVCKSNEKGRINGKINPILGQCPPSRHTHCLGLF